MESVSGQSLTSLPPSLPPSLSFPRPPSLHHHTPRPLPHACLSLSLACGILAARCGCCAVQTGNDAHPTPSRDRDRERDLSDRERGREGGMESDGGRFTSPIPLLPLNRIAIEAEIAYPISTSIPHTTSPATRYQRRYLHTIGMECA